MSTLGPTTCGSSILRNNRDALATSEGLRALTARRVPAQEKWKRMFRMRRMTLFTTVLLCRVTSAPSKPPPVQYENPWDTYKSVRLLECGDTVATAYTRSDSAKMVIIKKLSSGVTKELAIRQHENLLAALELYKFDGALFVVTNYTATTLKQRISRSSELP
jgi:hypothetical protein